MKKTFVLSTILFMSFISLFAQRSDCIFDEDRQDLINFTRSISEGWIDFMPIPISEEDLFSRTNPNSLFNIGPNDELIPITVYEESIDDIDHKTVKYKQHYKGVPVECGVLIGHWQNCFLKTLNGDFFCDLDFDITEVIDENIAIQKALVAHPSLEYIWENTQEEQALKEDDEDPTATHYPKPELLINCGGDFVYRMNIRSLDPIFDIRVDVNAKDGAILDSRSNQIECFHTQKSCTHEHEKCASNHEIVKPDESQEVLSHQSSVTPLFFNTTTGSTLNNGLQTLKTKWSSGKYRLKDEVYGPKVETRNANGSLFDQSFGSCSKMELEGLNNTVWPTSAVRTTSVHWSVTQCKEYFSSAHNNSVGAGKNLKVKANFGFQTCGGIGVLAYYSPSERSIAFGDASILPGSAGVGYLGVLDVVGHEYTHFAIDVWGGLTYQGESGALNESFADIFGYMIDRRVNGATEWALADKSGGTIRDMAAPGTIPFFDGGCFPVSCATTQPDTYLGANWAATGPGTCDAGGVHVNSGVQNRWFSLLSEGGTLNGVTVQGIGQEKAAAITFRNLVHYIIPNSNYPASRNGAVRAAEDLYGSCSFEHIQTQLAWEAVGVGTLEGCFQVTSSTTGQFASFHVIPLMICDDGSNLPLSVNVNGSTTDLTWTAVDFSTILPGSNTEGWSYTINGPFDNILTINSINTTTPTFYFFIYEDELGNRGIVMFMVVNCPGLIDPNDPSENFDCKEWVNTRSSSSEGESVFEGKLQLSPNPTEDYIEVTGLPEYTYDIYNTFGAKIKSGASAANNKIDISQLVNGAYVIVVEANGTRKSLQFVKL